MTCREFAEFLGAWLDGDLAAAVAAEFERHLAVCPHCHRYLESYRATIALGRHAGACGDDDPLPADVPPALVSAILKARRGSPRST